MSLSSPCVRNCCLGENDICLGCYRSLDEILLWGLADTSSEEKHTILNKAKERKYKQHPSKQSTS